MLLALKFYKAVQYGRILGSLLSHHPQLATGMADCVIPIPLHKKRLLSRGYNQSLEIARPIAKRFKIPLMHASLARIRETRPQTGYSLIERQENTRNAFAASKKVHGRHVLLVDDTLTTGATIEAATLCLLRSGAVAVTVAVVGRTPRRNTRILL